VIESIGRSPARWQRDLRFIRGDAPQEKLHKLEAALTGVGTSLEDIALIADFLSVPLDDRHPALDFNPRRRKERIFEALIRRPTHRALAGRDECRRAFDLLTPAYSVFSEGFDTADLKEGKAVLDELAVKSEGLPR
jgi:hypothetical protein